MKKEYKALGGLFEFKYYTGDDVDELNEEELGILKEEVDRLQEKIETKNLQAKVEKKAKTAKDILGDKDIPYEVRMKYIIDAYKKDQEKWGKLAGYAKHLEAEVIRLKNILITNGYTDPGIEGVEEPAQLIKKLRAENNELKKKLKDTRKAVNDPAGRIKVLEERINNVYPKRVHALRSYKKVIKSQEDYIKGLQELLDENGIKYEPKQPLNDIEAKGADAIDENTVRD